MTSITIHSFARYRELFGEKAEMEIPTGSTISDALILFAVQKPQAQTEIFDGMTLKSHVVIMYNKERIDTEEATTITLQDGDEVVLYPPVSGG